MDECGEAGLTVSVVPSLRIETTIVIGPVTEIVGRPVGIVMSEPRSMVIIVSRVVLTSERAWT